MEEILTEIEHQWRRLKIARLVCIAGIGILYVSNFIIRAVVYRDSLPELLLDFLLPLCIAIGLYVAVWKSDFSMGVIYYYISKIRILVFCVPAIVAAVLSLASESKNDTAVLFAVVLAAISMSLAPHSFHQIHHAFIATILQAVVFSIVAVNSNNNVAAMVIIAFTAVVLLYNLPKKWNLDENNSFLQGVVSILTLLSIMLVLLMIDGTGIMDAYVRAEIMSVRDLTGYVNYQCQSVLTSANFVGPVYTDEPASLLFENRIFTLVLAEGGWLAVMPVLIAAFLLVISGCYLCHRSGSLKYHPIVASMAVTVIQSSGYLLGCIGRDGFLFPAIFPFLDGGFGANSLFLTMAIFILEPEKILWSDPRDVLAGADLSDIDCFGNNATDLDRPSFEGLSGTVPTNGRAEGIEQYWRFVRSRDENDAEEQNGG